MLSTLNQLPAGFPTREDVLRKRRVGVAELILITFSGCQNADKARALLIEADFQFGEVSLDESPKSHAYQAYTSPTLLDRGKIVFGARTDSGVSGCTLGLPNIAELKRLLRA